MIFLIMQTSAKYSIQQILNSAETRFEKLVLSHEEFRLARIDDGEIMFDGKMYDLKNVSIHDGFVEVIAYHDKKEDRLIASIESFFGINNEAQKEIPIQVLKLITSVYLLPDNSLQLSAASSKIQDPGPISQIHISFKKDVFSPPPEPTV